MVDKLRVRQVRASLCQSALVAALKKRIVVVVKEAASSVARLLSGFASRDVKDEDVSWNFLVLFDLDDVTCLERAPVRQLEGAIGL